MAWEQRGGRSYYYLKERQGGRVRSKYIGTGISAQICAANARDAQRERTARRAMRQGQAEVDRQLATAEATIAVLTDMTLYAAGFHKHKGQWRKKRREE